VKLCTSTGDYSGYVSTITEKIRHFKGSPFRYINLEQTGTNPAFLSDDENLWQHMAEEWGEAGVYAGVEFVVSHSPIINPFDKLNEDTYQHAIRAARRSIEICHRLNIPRIVVHASQNPAFTAAEFARQNKRFYSDLFDLMERYSITVMTENVDDGAIYTPLSTGQEMREFIEYVDHPLFAGCWDTAHANINKKAKADGFYKCLTDIGDKLKGLHISDNLGDGAHHHSWPFAGIINFDAVMQGLLDAGYDGYFTFEASYTLLHHTNMPYNRKPWVHEGETVTKLLDPPVWLKKKAVELLYETGKYILETYNCFEE